MSKNVAANKTSDKESDIEKCLTTIENHYIKTQKETGLDEYDNRLNDTLCDDGTFKNHTEDFLFPLKRSLFEQSTKDNAYGAKHGDMDSLACFDDKFIKYVLQIHEYLLHVYEKEPYYIDYGDSYPNNFKNYKKAVIEKKQKQTKALYDCCREMIDELGLCSSSVQSIIEAADDSVMRDIMKALEVMIQVQEDANNRNFDIYFRLARSDSYQCDYCFN